jgi:aspartyl-tRNA(Asn)/glutamyl-tRNA(Gln) amidotransferase subunit A
MGLADAAGVPTTDLSFHSRNPWDLDRVPGSSSAGGCAAVSGGVIPLAFGSDGGGSTRLPAAWSGLLGLHPTLGRVPMGEPPGSSWNTSLGPLTRDARSGALALQAVAGPDGGELFSLQTDAPDYLTGLDAGIDGLLIAWTDDYGFARTYAGEESERVIHEVRSAAFGLAEVGASVVPTDEVFPEWRPMLGLAPQGVVLSHDAFLAGQDCRRAWWDGLRRVFASNDVLATTTIQHVAFPVERWNEAWNADMLAFSLQWCAHTFPQNFLGWPALAVPCGLVDGLPVSLHLTAPPDGEGLLYRAAAAVLASRPLGLPAGLSSL